MGVQVPPRAQNDEGSDRKIRAFFVSVIRRSDGGFVRVRLLRGDHSDALGAVARLGFLLPCALRRLRLLVDVLLGAGLLQLRSGRLLRPILFRARLRIPLAALVVRIAHPLASYPGVRFQGAGGEGVRPTG
ncbi:hypothetical protein MICRO8M_80391 [Microbacterium sp. 8M]|nr:hypothetical protein MICRO8M_80391 [Microbacterium sp. 8M]